MMAGAATSQRTAACEAVPGRLVFKAHRLLDHSTLGSRVIKKKKKGRPPSLRWRPAMPGFLFLGGTAPPPGTPPAALPPPTGECFAMKVTAACFEGYGLEVNLG